MLHSFSSRIRRVLAAAAIVLPVVLSAASAAAPTAADAQLAITLTSGAETISDGDAVTYTAEIRNTGATVDARVVLAPPAYVTLGSVQGAAVENNEATWSVSLEGAATTTLEIPATVAEIPDGELRATALVSVYVGDEAAPLIRTAVADLIEGVADEQVVAPASGTVLLWVGVGAVLVLAAAAVVFFVLRTRRRPTAAPEAADMGEGPPRV